MVLAACVVDFTEFVDGHAAVPESEIVDVTLKVVAIECGAVLSDVPCHAAGEICVFDAAVDDPVELPVGLALAEAGDAFGGDGDGVECPFVRNDVINAHVRASCVIPTAEVEVDARIRGIVDVSRSADDEARPSAVSPVLVAEDCWIADMRRRETDPECHGEVVAVLQLKVFRVFQYDAFADIFAAGDAQAFAKLAAFDSGFDVLADDGDFEPVGGDVDGRLRVERQIGEKAFRQRTALDLGNFRADDMAIQIQWFEIDSEMGQRRDGHVVVAWDAGQRALRYMLADHEDRYGVGVAAEHAVVLSVAAVIAGDENQPVFVGEIRPRGDGVEQLADDDIGLLGGVDVFLAVGVEAIGMAAVIDFADEEQRGVGAAVGGGVEAAQVVAVGRIFPLAERHGGMFGGVFVLAP